MTHRPQDAPMTDTRSTTENSSRTSALLTSVNGVIPRHHALVALARTLEMELNAEKLALEVATGLLDMRTQRAETAESDRDRLKVDNILMHNALHDIAFPPYRSGVDQEIARDALRQLERAALKPGGE